MKTLIIYDDKGNIFSQITGSYIVPQGGINFLETEIPEDKILKSVDVSVTPHAPIFEDIPKTQDEINAEKIALMQKAIDDLVLGGV